MSWKTAPRPLGIESLEQRRVFAAGLNPNAVVQNPLDLDAGFNGDAELTASMRNVRVAFQTYAQAYVDGSDLEDQVTILNVDRVNRTVQLKLERLENFEVISSRVVNLQADRPLHFAAVKVDARQGNDSIINQTGSMMWVDAGHGNDLVWGGSNADTIRTGDGDDFVVGLGGADTIYGGANNDVLLGGDGEDHIYGEAGEDEIRAGRGDDKVEGGADNDLIYGDQGLDKIKGDSGGDTLFGDTGNATHDDYDLLMGGAGNDVLSGEGGNDYLYGHSGDDLLNGGAGNDSLYGGSHADTLLGGGDNDHLWGEDGVDRLWGDEGHDELNGGNSQDFLRGGTGNDRLDAGYETNAVHAEDQLFGELGADTFVKHKRVWFDPSSGRFMDYRASEGDRIENDWHV